MALMLDWIYRRGEQYAEQEIDQVSPEREQALDDRQNQSELSECLQGSSALSNVTDIQPKGGIPGIK
jgi:hypothetical protein